MAHRMGRAYARETYPEPRRNTTLLFARNFAEGPKVDQEVTGTSAIEWSSIDSIDPWDATVTYQFGDIVSAGGSTWQSIANDNIGNNPVVGYPFWVENSKVPITPLVTGVVVVAAVVTLENTDENIQGITLTVLVDAAPVYELNLTLLSGVTAIPVLAEVTGLPLGTTALVSIEITEADDVIVIVGGDSTVELREMQFATG